MKQKRFLLILLFMFLLQSVGVASIVLHYDPFFHYHKPKDTYSYPMKDNLHSYINPGIAKNFDYDTIILGSSMTRAMQPSYIESLTNETCVKLSIPSAYGKDIKDMFDVAVKRGHLKHVILAVDAFAYADDKDLEANDKPMYLFNDNPFDDIEYVLNKTVLFDHIPSIIDRTKEGLPSTTMDEYQNYAIHNTFGREAVLRKVQSAYFEESDEEKPADYYLQRGGYENIKQNLLALIEEHPEIHFDLYMPPYGILKWYTYHQSKDVVPYLGIYEYIASQVIPYENVSLYFYQGETDVITNLDNYMDTMHPSEEVNRNVIQYMQDPSHRLTMDNYKEKIADFQSFIEHYNFEALMEEARELPSE